ncbi:MAG: hypothetical protein QOD74_2265 [Variibacter sp.]|jgi:hypothetical protein|nr:hypothetical protein [Variibacter sp.]
MWHSLAVEQQEDPWVAAMRAGDFDGAWHISDAILQQRVRNGEQCWHRPRHLQFVWRGGELSNRRVLVRCYHGLGDTLQFIRFGKPLRAIAREVIVWVQPALLPLVASAPGVDFALPLTDGTPDVAYDVDIEIMELAHALRVSRDDVGAYVPYLAPPQTRRIAELARDKPNVGLVWQAGDWDTRRSVPDEFIRMLSKTVGVNFVSLQRGASAARSAQLGLRDLSSDDVTRTADVIAQLDLTISVDTMVAHLAGALGCPVWTLLQAHADWRWMEDRDDSPWYPTMRLFRQSQPGEWLPVVHAVRRALAERFG